MSKLKYYAYTRKSEEREERQELSIPAQLDKIASQFKDLEIIYMNSETRSAFKPGNRPIFTEMISRIKDGHADGIIGWHPNRLSRNEIEAAELTYLLRTGVIKDLKFCTYNFDNSPEGIWMLQMAMSQSQYESAKQGRDVKRGMEQKVTLKGERPGQVPQGYIKAPVVDESGAHIRVKDKIITTTANDPLRFDLIKKMWTMLIAGSHSGPEILKIVNNKWGFTTHRTRRIGGIPMSPSLMYKIFSNPFYAGFISHNGELHKGNHEAMISLDEFDYVQKLLGSKGKPRISSFEYAYTGIMRCGECNCTIVGKHNSKFVKREGKVVDYVHYYCTRKSEKRQCLQKKYTRVEDLEKEIDAELSKYTILPEFRDLALEILNRNHKVETTDRSKIYEMQKQKRQSIQSQIDSLIDMRTRDLIDDNEYASKRQQFKQELSKMDDNLRSTEKRADDWIEITEKAFDFAAHARERFKNGTKKQKRQILMSLGSNFTLKDGKISLTPHEWLIPIAKEYPAIEKSYLRARTNQKATSSDENAALESISESWRARRDLNPRHPA